MSEWFVCGDMLNWNFVMGCNSVGAGIYMEWERQLCRRVTDIYVPEEANQWLGSLQMKMTVNLTTLQVRIMAMFLKSG